MADLGNAFQGHVTGPLNSPFVVLFEQDRAEAGSAGSPVGEDAGTAPTSAEVHQRSLQSLSAVGVDVGARS